MNKEMNYNQKGTSNPPSNQMAIATRLKKRRKFLLALPILVWPFLAIAFWAMGGGSSSNEKTLPPGLNSELPEPSLKPQKEDKLSLYDLADIAEKKRKEAILNDPYFKDSVKDSPLSFDDVKRSEDTSPYLLNNPGTSPLHNSIQEPVPVNKQKEDQEQAVLQRLEQLHESISQGPPPKQSEPKPPRVYQQDVSFSDHVNRLEDMVHLVKEQGGEDPEMQKLQGVLERIVDIQHPERVHPEPEGIHHKESAGLYTLSTTGREAADTGFYGTVEILKDPSASNSIEAVVQGNQLVQDGSIIKLKLAQPVFINNVSIPMGIFVYGRCHFNEERLEVIIPSIRSGVSIYPVKLEVYDLDGLPGICIPGGLAREVAKASGSSAVQRVDMPGLDPSLKAQVAAAGVNAAKSFFSKKITRIQVNIKSGYQVLLKQN